MSDSQVKKGVILNYILIAINAIVGLVYTPYMLRKLGQDDFGLYSLAASVIAYLTVLDFGFGNAIIRYTAKYRAQGKLQEQYKLFGLFLSVYIVLGVIAFIIGLGLYFNIDSLFDRTMTVNEIQQIRIMVMIMIFNVAITFPFSVFGAIISAYERFVFQKTLNICRIILNTLVMILLLTIGYKAVAMVIVQTVFNILVLAANVFYCLKKLKIRFIFAKFDKSLLREIMIYSFWIFLNIIMDRVYWSTGQFVLGATVGAFAIAVFSLGIHLQSMYMSFSTAISGVFLPRITGLVANNHSEKSISNIFIRTGRIQYIVMAFILFGFIVFGRPFIEIWAGDGYEQSYIITLIFFIALLPPLIQDIGITILQARNQMKFRSLLYIGIAAVSLVLQIILSKKFGAVGCAIAIGGALVIGQGIVMNIYYHKVQHLDIISFWAEIAKMSVVPIVMTVLAIISLSYINCYNVRNLAIMMVAYSGIYATVFWKFSLNQYEKELIGKPIIRIISKFKKIEIG